MLDSALEGALRYALGSALKQTRRLSGGDINDAFELELMSGVRVFLKTNPNAPASMFPAEAHGLDWLRSAGALRIPEVLAVSNGNAGEPSFMVLELLGSGRRRPDFDARLGHGLAQLHRFGAPHLGLERDNFVGSLP